MLKDEPPTPADRPAPIPELLEDFKTQRGRLQAQTRELERLRELVRGTAEREAAAIVTAARRDVRQVLLDARRELLVLVAQLQAVGCDTQSGGASRNMMQGEATLVRSERVASPSPAGADPFGSTREVVSGARRDVREVLLEAQSELIALSEEAKELRARIARRHESDASPSESQPSAADVPPMEPPQAVDAAADEGIPWEAALPLPAYHTAMPSSPRLWIGLAAAIGFAVVGLGAFLLSGSRGEPVATPSSDQRPAGQPAPAVATGSGAAQSAATPAPDPGVLSIAMEVRNPAWIRTTVDGTADTGRLYAAGETRRVTAKQEVVLRAGNAGAVFVAVNGGEATALGADGRVVTRRFGSRQEPAPPAPSAVMQTADAAPREIPPRPLESARADVGTAGTAEPPPVFSPAGPQIVGEVPAKSAAEREVLRITQRWFEAYFGGDRSVMAEITTNDFAIADQRDTEHRLPPVMPAVDRSLQQIRVEVAGDGAVLSARLIERTSVNGEVRELVSLVSGVWIRREGRWRLMGLRFLDAANLGLEPR